MPDITRYMAGYYPLYRAGDYIVPETTDYIVTDYIVTDYIVPENHCQPLQTALNMHAIS
jgi:hypothetical protein